MITTEKKKLAVEPVLTKRSLIGRLWGSSLILTVIFLVLIDAALAYVKPLSFFDVTEFVPLEQNPMVAKLKSFIEDRGANPEAYVLGSSLMLFPAVRCDEELAGKKHRYDSWFIRHGVNGALAPRYLSQQLQRAAGRPVAVVNLGVQGSIVSDQLLVLQRALEKGKTPRLVFLELAPRSLLDNWHKNLNATPIHQVLADLSAVPDLLAAGKLNKETISILPGYFWYFYKVKADYRTLVVNLSASILNRPLNSWEALRGIRHKPVQGLFNPEMEWNVDYTPKPRYHDLPMYKEVYNPPDAAFWKQERDDLDKFLALARRHHVKVVLVDMPVTAKNLALVDPAYLARYRLTIDELASCGVPVLRLAESGQFSESDFEDSAHLNAQGGHKLFAAMSQAFAQIK